MKTKGILTFVFCLCVGFVFGQNTFPASGNAIMNNSTLNIRGTHSAPQQIVVDVSGTRAGFRLQSDGGGNNTDDWFGFTMRNDVSDVVTTVFDKSTSTFHEMMKFNYLIDRVNFSNNVVTNVDKMAIGRGNINPTAQLEVDGQIHSTEVKVSSSFADYVFSETYKVPTLKEEEDFIKKNKHLIGFESEKEMNGQINLGDVTVRQQEKIELIMLHLIELNRKIESLEKENKELKSQK